MTTPIAQRYYTVAEVNRLIPTVQRLFAQVMQIRGQLKQLHHTLDQAGHPPTRADFAEGGINEEIDPALPPEVQSERARFRGLVAVLRDLLTEVQDTGCVIKDVEEGLVDWYALHQGREVFLCWRFGEAEVGYWHELSTGFSGRRPVAELELQEEDRR